MVILGIDPGLAATGWALIETDETRKPVKLSWGCIRTPAGSPTPDRLMDIRTQLLNIIAAKKPARAVVEKLFFEKNAKTAMAVGEARGAIITALAEQHIPILELTPLQMKSTLTGQGNADKKQVQKMLALIFKLDAPPKSDDAADALALAYCGMQTPP
jgi:crossover junction endodeoxyribonuclease RuvC